MPVATQQECIPVGCIPIALYHTGESLSRGFLSGVVSVKGGLCQGDPRTETPSPRGQNDASKNIALSQTSFVGGKDVTSVLTSLGITTP